MAAPALWPLRVIQVRGAAWVLALALAHPARAAEDPRRVLAEPPPVSGRPLQVSGHLMDPREHPDYGRHHVKPPSWDLVGHETRFTVLRGFPVTDARIRDAEAEIDRFTRVHRLGDVIWPSYPVMFATNLNELAELINRRQLFLFDVWGFVPGSGPGGYWQQFQVPRSAFETLEGALGPRWLGMDIGEQDGRYVGGYASELYPTSTNRLDQYLNFHRHFDAMSEQLGDRLCALVSLNFGHYLVREGTYSVIGAETGQALPNSQVYYAFIRGAGRQYGVPWFGNASIYNRWGYKAYDAIGDFAAGSSGRNFGPTKGTSLSLLKRLLYSHILYDSMFAGFEQSWFQGDQLSPVGRIQQAAQAWVKEHGQPGALQTPVALFLDFEAGWTFPRHLYSDKVYRAWGNLPYGAGDYLTDGVLDLIYPGYVNSSFFHDESGFLAPTPFGDVADCLLSDAPLWLLQQYPLVIVAGELSVGREVQNKLEAYVESGGYLVITAGNLARFPTGLRGVRAVSGEPRQVSGEVRVGTTLVPEAGSFAVSALEFPPDARWLASVDTTTAEKLPLAVTVASGRGECTVLASPFGVATRAGSDAAVRSEIDQPLPKPYPLLKHVQAVLGDILRRQQLFEFAGDDLSVITCRKALGEYTIGVFNNGWQERPFRLESRCGPIASLRELPLDQSEKTAVGHLPEGLKAPELGTSGEGRIAGGDVRLFAVRVQETGVEDLSPPLPPAAPRGRILPLRGVPSIEEAILARPTFFQHFDGVLVDWRYLHERDRAALQHEARWLRLQKVRVVVDLTSGLNLYPDLRLVNNATNEYERSRAVIQDVVGKMEVLGAHDLVFTLHRFPENNFTTEQTENSFLETVRWLGEQARGKDVTAHLRLGPGKPPWTLDQAIQSLDKAQAANLKLAVNPGWLAATGVAPEKANPGLKDHVGLWLFGGVGRDVASSVWTVNAPPVEREARQSASWLALAPEVPVVFDAVFPDLDSEYVSAAMLEKVGPIGR